MSRGRSMVGGGGGGGGGLNVGEDKHVCRDGGFNWVLGKRSGALVKLFLCNSRGNCTWVYDCQMKCEATTKAQNGRVAQGMATAVVI